MGLNDRNQLRFFESVENLKRLLHKKTGRTISTSRAQEIAACIQQGRQFYEAAESSPLEIRPLQQFYGMVGFAKALVCARRFAAISTLAHGHGVKDISAQDTRIAELKVKIGQSGTFCEFNNEVSDLSRLHYIDRKSQPVTIRLRAARSNQIANVELSLKDILGRIPFLDKDYGATFAELANSSCLGHVRYEEQERHFSLSFVDHSLFENRDSLVNLVTSWRNRFPYLATWRVIGARRDWGYSTITMANVPHPATGEFNELNFVQGEDGNFETTYEGRVDANTIRQPIEDSLLGIGGGYTTSGQAWAIAPIQGSYISEFSLHYLALFLLSSLVRYRPDAWVHAVTRTSRQERPVDDQCLALIERFLQIDQAATPELVVRFINNE